MSDTLDTASDAAEGDLDAWKYLVMAFSVLALVGGMAVGAFYTLGRGVGSTVQDVATDTAESISDSGENISDGWGA